MRVRINIGLDFDGLHTFHWQPSDAPGAMEVPRSTLDRWTAEREAFQLAYLRWRRVMEEVEEFMHRAEEKPEAEELAVATVGVGASRRRR